LPGVPFEYAEWKSAKVHPDYHVEVNKIFYSVPHQLIGRRVEVRLTHRVVEIFHAHQRIASHVRRWQRAGHVTVNEHMPKAHQRYANMTPASLIQGAARIGPKAAILVERVMRARPHPEQGYRSAMGIIALARRNERGWPVPSPAKPRGSIIPLRVPRLFENLAMTRLDGRFPGLVDKLARVQLLVFDDWGTHSLNDQQRLDLLRGVDTPPAIKERATH
jgi:hypothetical protein